MLLFVDYLYKQIGGVAQIVINTTLELNLRGLRSKVYCSSDSYEYKKLKENKADFIFIDSDSISLKQLKRYIDPDDVIILTHIDNTPLLEKIKHLNNKIIFYVVHPSTFTCYNKRMNTLCGQKKAMIDFIETLWQHNSICFMDWPNLKSVYDNGLKVKNSIKYLPVPVKSYLHLSRNYPFWGKSMITYMGRGNARWKIFPFIKILEDLNQIDETYKIIVITDVNDLYEKMIVQYIPNNKVPVEYVNNLNGEKLDKFLYYNSFMHIAMGTSALEGAKLGIPTILVDYSEEKFPNDYLYRWIYETQDFCLAGEIKNGVLPYSLGNTLHSMIKKIETDEGYSMISSKCKSYVDENHSISSFVDSLLEKAEETTLTSSIYCSTKFSKNMKTFVPIIKYISKVKHIFVKL